MFNSWFHPQWAIILAPPPCTYSVLAAITIVVTSSIKITSRLIYIRCNWISLPFPTMCKAEQTNLFQNECFPGGVNVMQSTSRKQFFKFFWNRFDYEILALTKLLLYYSINQQSFILSMYGNPFNKD